MSPDQISAKLREHLEAQLSDSHGRVHVETMLSALGALAGFGCQIAVREAVKAGRINPEGALVEVTTNDGGTYYFGDQINQPLLEAPISVWKLIAGAAQHAGAKDLPDIIEIVRHVSATVGGGGFGVLRIDPKNQPHEAPVDALKKHWQPCYALISSLPRDPLMTGWYFAGAAQSVIVDARQVIDPALACRIVMEAAVAMSKVDPRVIGFEI
ncbi:MAG: hypothetical protein EON61_25010 [Alphaproteobacteria bacterium]|jgi:hypothetical protein|nr:MAG: hypothetical protein EON61_25010 [Alphaproteobacteria bacterium]